jgi:hypothetical protein
MSVLAQLLSAFLLCPPAYNTGDMSQQTPDLQDRYRLVGIRRDGSKTLFLGGMTLDTANRALAAVNEAGTFASVQIELDELTVPDPLSAEHSH